MQGAGRSRLGWLWAAAAALSALTGAGSARGQDVEGQCVTAQCHCPDGSWIEVPCSTGSCADACGGATSSDAGASSGGAQGPGLLQAIFDAFTPEPPTPEQIAAAEEAARKYQEEVDRSKREFQESVQARMERERRGRDLLLAWAAIQQALDRARGKPLPKELALPLMAPLPDRRRIRSDAFGQASCAAFHGELALAMGTWHQPGPAPMSQAVLDFIDGDRIAHEAGAVFDSGLVVSGCERYVASPVCGAGAASEIAASSDARADAQKLTRVLSGMEGAAAEVAEAERSAAEAQEHWRRTSDAARADQSRRSEKLEELKQLLAAEEARYRELLQDKREQERDPVRAWDEQKREMRRKFLERLAQQESTRDSAKAQLEELDRAQREQEQKEREQNQHLQQLFARAQEVAEEERARVEQERKDAQAAAARLRAAGRKPGGCFVHGGSARKP